MPEVQGALTLGLALLAGIGGGTMNALAGGGTFCTMPTLIALGLPSTVANASSNVALQPGAMASAWAYRAGLKPVAGIGMVPLAAIGFVGGLIGSALLVATPAHLFDIVVPWLLLVATLALAGGARAAGWLARRVTIGSGALLTTQFLLGIYGGYFGGGVGLMMAAAWGLLAGIDPRRMSGPRTLLLVAANGAATLVFIAKGLVVWRLTVPMLIGAVIGGYVGARAGRVLPVAVVRAVTLTVSAVMTVVFFHRAYG